MNDQTIALVTGASRGIGRAIAAQLATDGLFVIGTATGETGLSAISAALGNRGTALQLDVTDMTSIDRLIEDIEKNEYRPTVLVNNAAITRDNLLLRMKEDDWDTVINANLRSIYVLCKRLVRGMMKARYGRIVNLTSVVGLTGNPGQCNYAAAKAGVIGFTKSLAREVGSRKITVNTVAPGFIDTDMTKGLPDTQREALLQQIPIGRLGESQEIANAVSFLVSDKASYITGETLNVNGGMNMA